MKAVKNMIRVKDDHVVCYSYELDPVETEELDNTGYLEDEELEICMTKDADGNIKVYKIYHNWDQVVESRYEYNKRFNLDELTIKGGDN